MKYTLRHEKYPQLLTYAPDGTRIVFEDHLFRTEDPDLARTMIQRDDVKLESGKLPQKKK